MTWQVELTIQGAVDQTWSHVSDLGLFHIYNTLLREADREGWRGQLAWWPSGEARQWNDGGCHVIAPGMRETA